MLLQKLLIIGAVYFSIYYLGGLGLIHDAINVAQPEIIKLISNIHPDGAKSVTLITENGGVWESNSRALGDVLK